MINNQGDIGAVLNELGSSENAQGLLLTMATAGLTQGILGAIDVPGGGTLANVNANSSVELLLARNAVQGISSAVLESAVLGTDLEDAIRANLQGALINTVAAQGADAIGDAQLDTTSAAIAHALLGCAVGAANAGNGSGCAPGAAGAVIGELVAGLYADASGYDQLRLDANAPGASAEIREQFAIASNTMIQLAQLTGAGGALLIGGDAAAMNIAMSTAQNAAQNNRQLHTEEQTLAQALAARSGGQYTAAQIENAMRNSGNSALGETVATGMVVNTSNPNGVYDNGAMFNAGAQGTNTIVQTPPNGGQVDAALASFIQANTGGAASPYAWSAGQLGISAAANNVSNDQMVVGANWSYGGANAAGMNSAFNTDNRTGTEIAHSLDNTTSALAVAPVVAVAATAGVVALPTSVIRITGSAFGIGAGFDAAGQYVDTGTVRPAQSFIAGSTAALTGPFAVGATGIELGVLGASAVATNTTFNNYWYRGNTNVALSALLGGGFAWLSAPLSFAANRAATFFAPSYAQIPASGSVGAFPIGGTANQLPGAVSAAMGTTVSNVPSFIPLDDGTGNGNR